MTQTRDETLPAGGGVNRAQQDYWETDGPRQYQQFGDTNDALFAPAVQAMLDAAKRRPGVRVLDVGCGFGTSTLEAAGRVAPSGRVVGVDISAAMLQPARQRIAAAVSTPSGAPPVPITACTPLPTTAAAIPAERSPSPIRRMRAPVVRISSTSFAWRGRSSTMTTRSSTLRLFA